MIWLLRVRSRQPLWTACERYGLSNQMTQLESGTDRHSAGEYEFLRGLVGGMRCGVLTIDRSGRLMLINEPALQILGLEAAPPVGLPVELALECHPQLAQVLQESFTMASLPNRAEIELTCRGGETKIVGMTLSMVPGTAGEICGAAVFFKDLTYVEHKEEKERLKDRLAALGQMAANLAHEIRNPLASIEVTCSLLKRRLGDGPEERELLEKIITEVRRLNRTITSSLEFARPLELNLGYHDLQEILESALETAVGRRGKPAIAVERDFTEPVSCCLVDRDQLRQVFENLFLNAFEAMGEEGTLRIRTFTREAPASAMTPYEPDESRGSDPWSRFDRFLVIQVADTGPGIREDAMEKLFYPFFTTKKNGSGVGLSMARKIVDRHRGLLDVESKPGEGAVFTVHLPMVVQESEE